MGVSTPHCSFGIGEELSSMWSRVIKMTYCGFPGSSGGGGGARCSITAY